MMKLTKKMFDAAMRVSPTWVTNGHFAVKKSELDMKSAKTVSSVDVAEAFYGYATEMEDESFDKLIAGVKLSTSVEFKRTNILYETPESRPSGLLPVDKFLSVARVFRYKDTFMLIQDIYVKDVYVLESNKDGKSAAVARDDGGIWFIVMPLINIDNDELLAFAGRSE